jgi:Kef-type K+ transport system membrane component KefB
MPEGLATLAVVVAVTAAAPIVAGLVRGWVPQVVLLIFAGIAIGPEMLDWATPSDVSLLSDVGLGLLFLLAGYELDLGLFRERAGRLAIVGWTVSLLVAVAVVGLLTFVEAIEDFAILVIALTTTALGTLLPILRENQMLGGRLGRYFFAAGAVGEIAPILAIAVFLGASGSALEVVLLFVLAAIALAAARLQKRMVGTGLARIVLASEHATAQSTLRIVMALLIGLLFVSAEFGFDIVLGAFVAGMVVRHWAPGDVRALELKLDVLAYGFFVPIFFVHSGMTLDVRSVAEAPWLPFVLLAAMVVVRGLPSLFVYRGALPAVERVQMTLLTATALPLLVALTAIGVADGSMGRSVAASLVMAGVLSVLVLPLLAVVLHRRTHGAPGPGGVPSTPDDAAASRGVDPQGVARDQLDL